MIRGDYLPDGERFVALVYRSTLVAPLYATDDDWLRLHMFDIETPGVVRIKECLCDPPCVVRS